MRVPLLTAAALLAAALAARAEPGPSLSRERIVLRTEAGDVVLALYPDVAPKHTEQILRLVRLGVYDTTHVCRVEPRFVAQLSTALDREEPLTPEQQAAIHRLPAEFSSVPHRRATLSMAREDNDPDSGETSFSVLLGDAPHLDGKYTVFGEVVSGMDVIDEICKVPRRGNQPVVRVTVSKATVVDSPEALASVSLAGPRPVEVPESLRPHEASRSWEVTGGVALMVLCGLGCFWMADRLPKRVLLSLNLIGVLVGGFLLFVLLGPAAQAHASVALALFLGLLGVLKLMSRFESPA
jgi:cyclophilin family peptidyl-prolyl cis-trans isomerase